MSAITFTAHDGAVWRRGVFVSPLIYAGLLDAFDHSAAASDWWAPEAARIAAQLRSAIHAAETQARKAA